MIEYTVRVSSFASDQIADYAAYIADKSGFPEIANKWMDLVYATMQKLDYSPRRFVLAEESQYRKYDIHRQIIGEYLAIYRIDKAAKVVEVIGFRRGCKLPRPNELPE